MHKSDPISVFIFLRTSPISVLNRQLSTIPPSPIPSDPLSGSSPHTKISLSLPSSFYFTIPSPTFFTKPLNFYPLNCITPSPIFGIFLHYFPLPTTNLSYPYYFWYQPLLIFYNPNPGSNISSIIIQDTYYTFFGRVRL